MPSSLRQRGRQLHWNGDFTTEAPRHREAEAETEAACRPILSILSILSKTVRAESLAPYSVHLVQNPVFPCGFILSRQQASRKPNSSGSLDRMNRMDRISVGIGRRIATGYARHPRNLWRSTRSVVKIPRRLRQMKSPNLALKVATNGRFAFALSPGLLPRPAGGASVEH